jgi:multiple sugar transport system permease protein
MFFKITLPFLHPTTTFILITQTIAILQIFATPYLMTGGGPDNGTSTLMLLLYKSAFLYGKYGYAGAIGVILFILIAIIAVVQFRLTRSENVQY